MIQLWFFKGKSPVSKIIRGFTWSKYSHVSIVFRQRRQVIEAWYKYPIRIIDIDDMDHSPGTPYVIYSINPKYINITNYIEESMFHFAMNKYLNKKYDLLGILGFFLRKGIEDDKKWFCSEIAMDLFQSFNFQLLNCPSYKVSPGLLSYSPMLIQESVQVFKPNKQVVKNNYGSIKECLALH